jgi:hypothetical protein
MVVDQHDGSVSTIHRKSFAPETLQLMAGRRHISLSLAGSTEMPSGIGLAPTFLPSFGWS